jgi:hypothetical protein
LVQWTKGNYAAVRWVSCEDSFHSDDLSNLPVTNRDLSELEVFSSIETPVKSKGGRAQEVG